jgi:hypothetical protein
MKYVCPYPALQGHLLLSGGIFMATAVTWGWLTQLLIAVLSPVVKVLTAAIRDELVKVLLDLDKKAKDTPNPWDDYVVEFFLAVLGVTPNA